MRKLALAACLALGWTAPLASQDLAIGLGLNVTSIDPHFHNTTPNLNVAAQIFDRLVHTDAQQRPVPGLALSWRTLDPTTWEFVLRDGVKFSDGTPFEAQDVLASLRRAPAVPNSPSSFGIYTRAIASAEAPAPNRVVIRTREPYPLLPYDLSAVNIVSRAAETASTADFNSGRSAIGTGPFKVVSWTPGDRLVVERNPFWWGGAVPWARVTFRLIVNDTARVAALLAGDVQMIEAVPPTDIARLERDPALRVSRSLTTRFFFLHPDQFRDVTPFATDKAGNVLPHNPLQDARVRRAISHAINRAAIAERLFSGQAVPAGGVVPDGFFGGDPELKAPAFDPDLAKRLTVEITETVAIQDIDETAKFVAQVRELGCRVSLDDFGAGYTSFRNLKAIAVDSVKIDGSFVRGVASNVDNQLFIRTLLGLADGFGLETVAECVESVQEAQHLARKGVKLLQGYLFGTPSVERPWLANLDLDKIGLDVGRPALTVIPGSREG